MMGQTIHWESREKRGSVVTFWILQSVFPVPTPFGGRSDGLLSATGAPTMISAIRLEIPNKKDRP